MDHPATKPTVKPTTNHTYRLKIAIPPTPTTPNNQYTHTSPPPHTHTHHRRERSEDRDERTAEQRELDELTKDQRTVFVSQLVLKAGAWLWR